MAPIENRSKAIAAADDSAARLLMDLLDGSPGRNFDIESLFVERLDNGSWRFVIFEFLKAISIPPEKSHPNFYWYKNQRKFLSLWTIAKVFEKAGFQADLYLVNYVDSQSSIKLMKVLDIDPEATEIIRHQGVDKFGNIVREIRNWVATEDKILSYQDFKKGFKLFNKTKSGDTWELLSEILNQKRSS
jgi:hypothetical protein